ncbi:DUF2712 domain-containing protein [Bacillus mojavensis]|uniref:DUF2712 domain-containing protein n=1 Tax=Bacillus mojavensis TaxID=72360 RepID=UPI002DC016B4|nr:DUF2712 domain-containing protein [Bacillus mojavensis]MEC1624682.1 DUF2712 domain-containing protein [Bacillus mojavensis]
MKKFLRKNFRFVLAGALGVTLLAGVNMAAKASNDNYGYAFMLQPKHYNNYTDWRYRQTKHDDNPWKVNLKTSDEGKGTIATFWIEGVFDGRWFMASKTHDVKQGSGNHYYNANSIARQTNVKLGAENNNYSTNSYYISGYWDEETW